MVSTQLEKKSLDDKACDDCPSESLLGLSRERTGPPEKVYLSRGSAMPRNASLISHGLGFALFDDSGACLSREKRLTNET